MKKYKRNAKKRIFYNKKCYNCGNVDRFTIKEMRGLHFCQRCYKQHDTMCDVFANSVLELEQQNKLYRAALEFYADRENYKPDHYDPNTHEYMSVIDYDEGATARKALEESK